MYLDLMQEVRRKAQHIFFFISLKELGKSTTNTEDLDER